MGKDYYSPLNESYGQKYDDSVRIDLLKMLKEAPERALEIGCSWGGTGGFLKRQFKRLYYVGLELNEEAAARAR
ncbi:MAG: class I SAM-dependent methyltransferase, partial [Lentisphaerae bacterium]|nr:class I SAM-dependent methyltransferase [Lentisphaerota bacterium]